MEPAPAHAAATEAAMEAAATKAAMEAAAEEVIAIEEAAYPERDFDGTVLQVRKVPESTQNVVTYTAIISAMNPDLLLYPGMTATLRITVSTSGELFKVPMQALHFRPPPAVNAAKKPHEPTSAVADTAATIWVLGPDGRPTPISVGIGVSDETSTEVRTSRLTEGQPVVVGIAERPSSRGYFGLRLGF